MHKVLLLVGVMLAGCGGVQEPEPAGDPDGAEVSARELSDAVHEPLERAREVGELTLERKGRLDEAIGEQAP
jgi:hypothetical protein